MFYYLAMLPQVIVFVRERNSQVDNISQCDCLSQVEGMQVHANEGGVTQTRGGIYWIILPAGCKAFFRPLHLPYTSLNRNTN